MVHERGLASSRSHAKSLIMAGKVRSGTEVLDKAGKLYAADIELDVTAGSPYVSRGAEKLEGYFAQFPWPLQGKHFLDIGASTGGFSDYLLQAGAASGTCVDVGHGQLHYKLQQDPRITNLERVNARQLKAQQLPYSSYPLIVMDLSFISLRLILPPAWQLLEPDGLLVALIKPQFEAGKAEADRGRGVIRDSALRESIRAALLQFAQQELAGSHLVGCCESPITGVSGNIEYLAGWQKRTAVPYEEATTACISARPTE